VKSRTTKQFRALLASLPGPVQRQAQDAYLLFRANPFHPSLHFKSISATDPSMYSVRVGRRHRAVGLREADHVLWIWIGSHAEYDRFIKRP